MCNCAEHRFKMSDHLGVDGSYKNKHSLCVSWCHYTCFTLCLEHSPADRVVGRENKGTRSREKVDKREETESSVLPYAVDSDDMFLLSLPSPYAGNHRVHYCVALRQNPPAFLCHITQISKASLTYIITSPGSTGQRLHPVAPLQKHKTEKKQEWYQSPPAGMLHLRWSTTKYFHTLK